MNHDVADIGLADAGALKIEWAEREMPVLAGIRERFARSGRSTGCASARASTSRPRPRTSCARSRPAAPTSCSASSNPLSTQDDVAASLVANYGIPTFARQGRGPRHVLPAHRGGARHAAADHDGRRRDLVTRSTRERTELLDGSSGGTEETTTGVIRLRAMAADGDARVPGHRGQRGADQAPLRQPLRHRPERDRRHPARDEHPHRRASTVVVGGYGWVGRGIASRCARHGRASSTVVEVDPIRALEAAMDGYQVMTDRPRRRASATSSSPRPATSTSSGASTSRR